MFKKPIGFFAGDPIEREDRKTLERKIRAKKDSKKFQDLQYLADASINDEDFAVKLHTGCVKFTM